MQWSCLLLGQSLTSQSIILLKVGRDEGKKTQLSHSHSPKQNKIKNLDSVSVLPLSNHPHFNSLKPLFFNFLLFLPQNPKSYLSKLKTIIANQASTSRSQDHCSEHSRDDDSTRFVLSIHSHFYHPKYHPCMCLTPRHA